MSWYYAGRRAGRSSESLAGPWSIISGSRLRYHARMAHRYLGGTHNWPIRLVAGGRPRGRGLIVAACRWMVLLSFELRTRRSSCDQLFDWEQLLVQNMVDFPTVQSWPCVGGCSAWFLARIDGNLDVMWVGNGALVLTCLATLAALMVAEGDARHADVTCEPGRSLRLRDDHQACLWRSPGISSSPMSSAVAHAPARRAPHARPTRAEARPCAQCAYRATQAASAPEWVDLVQASLSRLCTTRFTGGASPICC